MTTDYNQISAQYREAKQHPWRSLVEEYSFTTLIGDLTGKKVIDLACGEGFFTRKLKHLGAANVTGADISEEMIALAKAQEAEDPLGIEYLVDDARALVPQQDNDVAVAAWLLNYSHDREELNLMCRGVAQRVRSGGRFVTFNMNPHLDQFLDMDAKKYGYSVRCDDRNREGAVVTWTMYLKNSSFEIENYYLPVDAHESALNEAGFRDVTFHPLSLSPEVAASERGYWSDILDHPPATMIEAIKA